MKNYRLVLEYAGTRFSGWQEQKNAVTIAGELREALEEVAGPVAELAGAGRTDAGVHALAQVAHAKLEREVDPQALREGVNERLPSDIHVLAISAADPRFHARHAALSRTYLYQVSRRRTAFAKKYVWWVRRELDVERMRRALEELRGERDFTLFCDPSKDRKSTRVRMDRAEIGEAGSLVLLRFEASNFLWRMVRRLVGALVEVGAGDLALEDFAALAGGRIPPSLAGKDAKWTAPPSGLFLAGVRYAGDATAGPIEPAVRVP